MLTQWLPHDRLLVLFIALASYILLLKLVTLSECNMTNTLSYPYTRSRLMRTVYIRLKDDEKHRNSKHTYVRHVSVVYFLLCVFISV